MNTISFKTVGPYRRREELRPGGLFEHDGQWYTPGSSDYGINVATGQPKDFRGLMVRAASIVSGDRFAVVEYLERDEDGDVTLTRTPYSDWPAWASKLVEQFAGPPAPRPVIQRAPGHRDAFTLMRRIAQELSHRLYRATAKVASVFRVSPVVFTIENLRPETFDDIVWLLWNAAQRLKAGELRIKSGGIRVDSPEGGLLLESNLMMEEVK